MADEIVPRRKRILDSGPKKLPDINSLLKNTAKPEFLQKTEESIFIEKEKAHANPTAVSAPPNSSATIKKAAEIHKFPVVKEDENSTKKYQNFVDYMQLRDIAGEANDEFTGARASAAEKVTSKAEKAPSSYPVYSQEDATYEPDAPAQNAAGGLYKGSKPIRKGDKRNAVKDKEEARRMKGQSSIATWKPEAFMKMRQEFD